MPSEIPHASKWYEIEVVLENGVLGAHMDAKRLVIDAGSPSSLGSDEIISVFGRAIKS